MRLAALHFGIVSTLLACASAPPPPPLTMRISNWSAAPVASIGYKPCGAPDSALNPVASSWIDVGESFDLVLPAECIDVLAFDAEGRVVGEQVRLKMLPGTTWALR
jgi:hypothetical protein